MHNKKQKGWVLPIIAFCLLLVLIALIVFVINPLLNSPETPDISNQYKELEEKYDSITYNEKTGSLYVNNEIIVMVNLGTTKTQVENLAVSVKAVVSDAMEDVGIYKFSFANSMTTKKVEEIIEQLKQQSIVSDAYMNTAFITETDVIAEEVEKKEAAYPNDSWNGDKWNMSTPGGENWGMEAIHAPAAWGYLSELNKVKVGLIDSVIDVTHEDISVIAKMGLTDVNTKEYQVVSIGSSYKYYEDHGTHVGGIIAANWNNGKGVSGVMGDKGELYYSAAYDTADGKRYGGYYSAYNYYKAIKILLDQGVQAINISQNTSRLISYAASRGNDNAIAHLKANANTLQSLLIRTIEYNTANGKPDFVICVAAGNANALKYVEDENATYGYKEYKGWLSGKAEWGDVDAKYNNFISLMDDERVMGRVIVVGSVGIDEKHSTSEETRYAYSYFSDIGSRVDVAGPGEDVYSAVCGGYSSMSGTSMATPHVTGVAGLVFAANPELTGPQVKQIIKASTYDRFVYTDGSCGLVDAELAVLNALQTVDHSIKEVISSTVSTGLDLCFLVDTTGSMEDDINNAKENMNRIIAELEEKGTPYRIALIDYRDFAERTKNSKDYPAKVQLQFSSDVEKIVAAINGLTLGNGGDTNETVFSAIAESLKLDWNEGAKKVIMIIGDAPPLDPEPYTGYTYDEVIEALQNAGILTDDRTGEYTSDASTVLDTLDTTTASVDKYSFKVDVVYAAEGSEYIYADVADDFDIDVDDEDKETADKDTEDDIKEESEKGKDSAINVYTIDTGNSSSAEKFFEKLSSETGGKFANIENSSQVADTIIAHLEAVEINSLMNINAEFGEHFSNEWVEIYKDGEYAFSFELNEAGEKKLYGIEPALYQWKISRLAQSGEMHVVNNKKAASITEDDAPWYGFALSLWYRNTMLLLAVVTAIVLVAVCTSMFSVKMKRKRKALVSAQGANGQQIQQPMQPQGVQPVEYIMQSEDKKS